VGVIWLSIRDFLCPNWETMSVTKADPTELTIWTVQMGLSRTQMRLSHASTLVGVELNRRLKNVLFLSKPLFNFAASQVYFFPKFGV
jgi:hypothetical protein